MIVNYIGVVCEQLVWQVFTKHRGRLSSKKASEECTAIYNQQTLDNIREELEYYTYYEAIPIVARVIDP
eukprot:COSAG01_NODE_534_length_15805_cov_9.468420_4_plen_69_part_00